ncbi:MAG: hypothetical protein M1825_000049 [Sarcosagium campestre]|nr:MAG: hypothetical protein M1825_000049 [Sarcosagium campestre]
MTRSTSPTSATPSLASGSTMAPDRGEAAGPHGDAPNIQSTLPFRKQSLEPIPSRTDANKLPEVDTEAKGDVESGTAEKSKHPPGMDPASFPDGGLQAWLVVLGGFCCLFCSFGWINCIGAFQEYYQTHQLKNYSPSTISWIPSLETFIMFLGGPFVGKLYDNHGPKYILLIGSFLHVFGLMMASISSQYYQFILTQGLLSPIGASMIFYCAFGVVGTWFLKHRALAFGVVTSGSSLGGVIFPIMVERLVRSVGFGWTMRISAFLILFLMIIANLTVRSRLPPNPRPFLLKEFITPLQEPPFLLVCAANLFFFFGLFLPFNFIISYGRAYGMSDNLSGYLLSILNGPSLLGRILPGYIADRVGRFNVMIVMTFFSAIMVLALWLPSRSNAPIITFAALYGFGSGTFVSLAPALVAQISDIRQIGVRNGTMFAIVSVGTLCGNPIGGALITLYNGSYTGLQIFSGVLLMTGSTVFVLARYSLVGFTLKKKNDTRTDADEAAGRTANEIEEFNCVEVNDFRIYRMNEGRYANEMAPLHHLCIKAGVNRLFFDGVLTLGNGMKYVQRVPFELLSIGGYSSQECHCVADQIWIQSEAAKGQDLWYRLNRAATEYSRYHEQFLWLANLSKHFADYLESHEDVRIHHFRQDFFASITKVHGLDESFQSWLREYAGTDFRVAVTANAEFLFRESLSIDRTHEKQPIWQEILPGNYTAVKEHSIKQTQTVVTPYVYECFKHLSFGRFLEPVTPDLDVSRNRNTQKEALHLTVDEPATAGSRKGSLPDLAEEPLPLISCSDKLKNLVRKVPDTIDVGDVVAVHKDAKTRWKDSAELWLAYVQDVKQLARGATVLKVIWLYQPSDTTCSSMYYPIGNELFFSDNCNCHDARLYAKDVVCKVSVALFSEPNQKKADFFIRQRYRHDDAFVTMQQSDLNCMHHLDANDLADEEKCPDHAVGDTILYIDSVGGHTILEPGVVTSFHPGGIFLRRLLRRARDLHGVDARPNELVYTDEILPVAMDRIVRKCHVRFYTEAQVRGKAVPAPYDRDGNADAYYIIYRQVRTGLESRLEPIDEASMQSVCLSQGFDPEQDSSLSKMTGLDIFCGGGSFGRGLEEGGAIQNRWAVDCDREAIHTYHANTLRPDDTELFFGSVNDFLMKAMTGDTTIPAPGLVDFIAAGSPCQGFSNTNYDRSSAKSLRNCSLVASVVAFVDFYRPKYALLENVMTMAKKAKKDATQNVFSQILCALVGMGYQVQQFNLDAWSFGSPQKRSRIFISIAAPGLHLPPHPAQSHSHPPETNDRALGVAANQEPFGIRRFEPTAFTYVIIREALSDLPYIGDGRTQTCVPFPDHRCSREESNNKRTLVSHIPIHPPSQSFMSAFTQGRLTVNEIEEENKHWWGNQHKSNLKSNCWRRVKADGLVSTITTSAHPSCAFMGTILHWDQHRLLTVMEVRRAQGIPDCEVLLGKPATQWKLVGNGVCRTVALALGMSLRQAWLDNERDTKTAIACSAAASTGQEIQLEQLQRCQTQEAVTTSGVCKRRIECVVEQTDRQHPEKRVKTEEHCPTILVQRTTEDLAAVARTMQEPEAKGELTSFEAASQRMPVYQFPDDASPKPTSKDGVSLDQGVVNADRQPTQDLVVRSPDPPIPQPSQSTLSGFSPCHHRSQPMTESGPSSSSPIEQPVIQSAVETLD